jgi:tryptophan-rich sensory protein
MSSIAVASSPVRTSRVFGWGRVARVGLAMVLTAVAANVLVYYVGRALVSYDPQFLPLANVSGAVVFTLPAAVVAALIYAALLRFARRPARTFAVIAAVVFVATLIPDFTYIPSVPGATAGQTAVLVLMHIVAAAVIVRMLTAIPRPQSR